MIDPIAVRRTPISGMPNPPACAELTATAAPSTMNPRARPMTLCPTRASRASAATTAIADVAENNYARYTAHMSDQLAWRLGARFPGHDYHIFSTGFVDAIHPRTGQVKRFSLIDCADWV